MSDHQSTQTEPHARQRRRWWLGLVPFVISLILLAVPWWTLLAAQTRWPTAVVLVGTAVFVAAFVALPALMIIGHGGRRPDWMAVSADTLLGAVWVLFTGSVLALVLRVVPLGPELAEGSRRRTGSVRLG